MPPRSRNLHLAFNIRIRGVQYITLPMQQLTPHFSYFYILNPIPENETRNQPRRNPESVRLQDVAECPYANGDIGKNDEC